MMTPRHRAYLLLSAAAGCAKLPVLRGASAERLLAMGLRRADAADPWVGMLDIGSLARCWHAAGGLPEALQTTRYKAEPSAL